MSLDRDTIAAIATAPGKGGVGIVRVSGPAALAIGQRITGKELPVRYVTFCEFKDSRGSIDQGLAIYFQAPYSFTGEEVVELHGHGGPVVMDMLLGACVEAGARLARPGEFSERAFLNDKIDLAQAEAIADLIDASSQQAARNALNSLSGQFSAQISELLTQLIELRMYVEAAIDFPEEEIDFLGDGIVQAKLDAIRAKLAAILASAEQGAVMHEGLQVVIAGKPNAGKSSLLNALAAREAAIVTDIAGTTRDVLREHINIDGLPLHIIDTAGLRDSDDPVEQEGIRRAWLEIEKADVLLLLVDASQSAQTDPQALWAEVSKAAMPQVTTLVVHNKIDKIDAYSASDAVIAVSAKRGDGLQQLKDRLKALAGISQSGEGVFSARARHVDALSRSKALLDDANNNFNYTGAGELLAEDLKQVQHYLNEITGEFSSDDLLGKIFGSFCIGK